MSAGSHPKLENVDLDKSFILGVIYDDESLTLEMDFQVLDGHPRFEQTDDAEGCYRKGFIRFADFDDLRLKKNKASDDGDVDFSVINTATIEGDYAFIDSGWGEIELTAQSIRIAVD